MALKQTEEPCAMPLKPIQNAQAQETGAPPAQPNALMGFLPFVIIFFIFYFLMIKPQKKKMEEEKKLLESLNKGDEVFTKSGLIGTICGLTEKVVTLQVEGAKIKVLRTQIGGEAKNIFQSADEGRA